MGIICFTILVVSGDVVIKINSLICSKYTKLKMAYSVKTVSVFVDCCIKINSLTSFSVTVGETLCLLFSLTLVLLSTHTILFFAGILKIP